MFRKSIVSLLIVFTMPFFVINCKSNKNSGGNDTDSPIGGAVDVQASLNCTDIRDPSFFKLPKGYKPLEPGEKVSIAPGLYQFDRMEYRLALELNGENSYEDYTVNIGEVNPNLEDLKSMSMKVSYDIKINGEKFDGKKGCNYFNGVKKDNSIINKDDLEYHILKSDLEGFFKGLTGQADYEKSDRELPKWGADEFWRIQEVYAKTEALVHSTQVLSVLSIDYNSEAYSNKKGDLVIVFRMAEVDFEIAYILYFKATQKFDLDEVYDRHRDWYPKQFRIRGTLSDEEFAEMTTEEMRNEAKERLKNECDERLANRKGWYGPSSMAATDLPTANQEKGYEGYCSPRAGFVDR